MTHLLSDRLMHWSVGPLAHWLVDFLIYWSIAPLTGWYLGLLIRFGWFSCSLAHWLLYHWFVDSMTFWFIDWKIHLLICCLAALLLHLFNGSCTHWFIDSLVHYFIQAAAPGFFHDIVTSAAICWFAGASRNFNLPWLLHGTTFL